MHLSTSERTSGKELAHRLGMAAAASWRLQQLPIGPELELLDDAAASRLMALFAMPAEDQQFMLAARPDPSRDAAWYLLLRGCVAELRRRMDQPLPSSGYTAWPRVPKDAGPVGMFIYAWALLAVVPELLEVQRRRGVPDAVARDTLSGLGTMMAAHAAETSINGVGLFPLWGPPQRVCGTNYTIGRHDFTRTEIGFGDGTAGYALQVHVPPTGRLIEAESVDSMERGLAFFAEHYPEEPISALVCKSWILDPQLGDYLPADSNLVRFQRRFQLLPAPPMDEDSGGDRANDAPRPASSGTSRGRHYRGRPRPGPEHHHAAPSVRHPPSQRPALAQANRHPVAGRMSGSELDQEAHLALTAWASIVNTGGLTAMPQVTNPLWRVEGAGPTLILKQLPQYPPGVAPVVSFRVLSHLQAHGVPVALPTLTDQGTLHATVNDRQWVLLPYLAHQSSNHELEPNATATATAIGAAIGHLDRALAAYPWPVESFVDDPSKIITKALPELPLEAVQFVEPFTDLLRDTCTGLPVQLTHGDCNDGNVLVNQDQVIGIIDIDHLPTGPRVRDLAYYLASRLRTHLAQPDSTNATAALANLFGDYVAGYHQTYPLTEQELRAIVPLMLLVEIGGAHWALNGWEPNRDNYHRSLQSIIWIGDHFETLVQAAQAH